MSSRESDRREFEIDPGERLHRMGWSWREQRSRALKAGGDRAGWWWW